MFEWVLNTPLPQIKHLQCTRNTKKCMYEKFTDRKYLIENYLQGEVT